MELIYECRRKTVNHYMMLDGNEYFEEEAVFGERDIRAALLDRLAKEFFFQKRSREVRE